VRISTKLTIGLSIVSGCILGAYGYWQYQQEETDLKLAAERDFRMLGVAVEVAVENSLRDRQTADIREILDSLEVGEPDIDVIVLDQDGQLTAHSLGQESSESVLAWLKSLRPPPEARTDEPVIWFGRATASSYSACSLCEGRERRARCAARHDGDARELRPTGRPRSDLRRHDPASR
jgi:hypothetical protein